MMYSSVRHHERLLTPYDFAGAELSVHVFGSWYFLSISLRDDIKEDYFSA